ncbi:hypothetical protein SEH50133_20564 [Salmonella enterica subsp. houtenae serovar 50:g,z51:- str. 01-0133]|nr:hypothetical protein SEH50133_20564 [Salmonella enterica subsp. houtenae serovar 50:g,z51:- str. 01-0133]
MYYILLLKETLSEKDILLTIKAKIPTIGKLIVPAAIPAIILINMDIIKVPNMTKRIHQLGGEPYRTEAWQPVHT